MAVIATAMLLLLVSCSSGNARTLDYYDDYSRDAAPVGTDGYFVDPQGDYELKIDPSWEMAGDLALNDVEVWFVAAPEDGNRANVNLYSQPAPGMDINDYMETVIQTSGRLIEDFVVISTSTIHRESKPDLGVLEATGDGSRFLAVVFIDSNQAVGLH